MRYKIFALAFALTFVALATVCSVNARMQSSKPLKNGDVIRMIKSGMSEEVVIQVIGNSAHEFDTSGAGLLALKKHGVPDPVIEAMVSLSSPKPNAEPSVNTDALAGTVTLIDGTKREPMRATVPSAIHTSTGTMKILKPLVKAKVLQVLSEPRAKLRITNPTPIFEVTLPLDLKPSDTIALVKLSVESKRRQVLTAGGAGPSGFSKDDLIPITIEPAGPRSTERERTYKVTTAAPLAQGEYALVVFISNYYDFALDSGQ